MYGAHREDLMRGTPQTLLASRQGAICVATRDGAVWISHLREPKTESRPYKLPAALAIGQDQLLALGVQESELSAFDTRYNNKNTYQPIWYENF